MKRKIVMLTAYDYPTAKILDKAGVDYILVGDSLGMTVLGYKDTKSVTIQDMVHHVRAVSRGVKKSKIISDMPINTYNTENEAVKNARMLLEAGAQAVKIEGNKPKIIKALRKQGIEVMGHLGLLPQTADVYKVQGRDIEAAEKIFNDARELDKLGILALILECIPATLAKKITNSIKTPTIGIGAGIHCSGQVLVIHDILGMSDFQGKFVKKYADVKIVIQKAVEEFRDEVISQKFPSEENSF